MDTLVSHTVTFLIGIATGAAGTYFGDKYTDRRRDKEQDKNARKEFDKTEKKMPDLIAEMRQDFASPEHATFRDFFILPKGVRLGMMSPNTFYYEEGSGNDYLNKVRILQNCGYVIDITPKNAPKFRMQEHFVDFLKHP